MSRKAMSNQLIVVIVSLIIVLAVAIVIIMPGATIMWSSSEQIGAMIPDKCNMGLQIKDYRRDIVMFAAPTIKGGDKNPYYDPELAIKNYIGYLDCRNKKLRFDLMNQDNGQIDTLINQCGKSAFLTWEQDLRNQMQQDPSYRELNERLIEDIKDSRPKIFAMTPIPPGPCEFDMQLG